MSRRPHSVARTLRPGIAAAALLLSIALGTATAAEGEPITVIIDRAKVMRISRPADVVIIGNPAIADATIQDNQTLIITGRSFGTTNLIVLDSAGKPIADEIVSVAAPEDNVVTVYSRSSRQTLSCTPECSHTVMIGDRPEVFKTIADQVTTYGSISGGAAGK